MVLSINNKDYKLKFGYRASRIFSDQYKIKGLGALGSFIAKQLDFKEGDDLSFQQLDCLGDLVLSGLKAANHEIDLLRDDVVEYLLQNMDQMSVILEQFTNSLVQGQGLGQRLPKKPLK